MLPGCLIAVRLKIEGWCSEPALLLLTIIISMGCDVKKPDRGDSSGTFPLDEGDMSLKKFNLNSVIGRGGFGKVLR